MTTTDDITEYDWQAEAHRDTFLSWMIPTILADVPWGGEKSEAISEASDSFRNISIDIAINGVPVPSKSFIEGVERNMRYFADKRGQEIVSENARLTALDEITTNITERVREAVVDAVRGTALENWNDEDRERW